MTLLFNGSNAGSIPAEAFHSFWSLIWQARGKLSAIRTSKNRARMNFHGGMEYATDSKSALSGFESQWEYCRVRLRNNNSATISNAYECNKSSYFLFFDSSAAIWTFSSVGKSNRLITGRPGVRVPEGPLLFQIDAGYSLLFNMLCSYREASTGVMTWNVKTAPHPG